MFENASNRNEYRYIKSQVEIFEIILQQKFLRKFINYKYK